MKTIALILITMIITQEDSEILFNTGAQDNASGWFVLDDSVMGGVSEGNVKTNTDGNMQFSGYVSTDNNGGFSSIRYRFNTKNVSKYKNLVLKVKGDGKPYQFRIKADKYQRYSYISTFETSGKWETITIPLNSFYPSFRGYTLNRPNYKGETMEEIAFLIGNKVKENFNLEIKSIYLKS